MPSSRPVDGTRLATFVQVARHGSLTAAARALGLTTSAVSQQMAALEEECDVALLVRESRGVSLTAPGVALLERAHQVVRALEDAGSTMTQLSGRVAGQVRVGTIASGAASVVLPACRVLRESAPDVRVQVATMEPSRSIDALLDGRLDLALIDVYDHVPLALPAHLLVDELLTEPLVLVAPPDQTLPRPSHLAALRDHDWVLPPADAACGAATRYACRSAGFEPRVRWETDDLLLLVAAVSRGEGIALLPRRAVADSVAPVQVRRMTDPALSRRVLTVARPGAANQPTLRACLDALAHVVRRP